MCRDFGLNVCLLFADRRFFGGLAFSSLSYHQGTFFPSVLWTTAWPLRQISHRLSLAIPSFKILLCSSSAKLPLLIYGWGHFLVHGARQSAFGMGRTIFSDLFSSLLFCCLGPLVLHRVQEALRDIQLDQGSDGSVYDS